MKLYNISDIQISGIDHRDAPDYVDAFVDSAIWSDSGLELTEDELEELNEEHRDFVNEQVLKRIY